LLTKYNTSMLSHPQDKLLKLKIDEEVEKLLILKPPFWKKNQPKGYEDIAKNLAVSNNHVIEQK